jgi:hypothetical protein
MGDSQRRNDSSRPHRSRRDFSPAERRIEWARSMSNKEMEAVLQNALLRARGATPRTHEVVLLEEVVHELKSRLMRYDKCMGPPPPAERRYENEEE